MSILRLISLFLPYFWSVELALDLCKDKAMNELKALFN